jgi:KUP system potassium uptake protein
MRLYFLFWLDNMHRADRTAIYAVANPGTAPQALMHNRKHN